MIQSISVHRIPLSYQVDSAMIQGVIKSSRDVVVSPLIRRRRQTSILPVGERTKFTSLLEQRRHRPSSMTTTTRRAKTNRSILHLHYRQTPTATRRYFPIHRFISNGTLNSSAKTQTPTSKMPPSKYNKQSSSGKKSSSSDSNSNPPPPSWTTAVQETLPMVGTFAWRLCLAYGFVYVFWEYGVEITICEGPSMIPTLKGDGDEIVLLDRWTPLRYGLQGGPSGSQRGVDTRHKQRQFVLQQQPPQKSLYPNLWHEPKIPANRFPTRGIWARLWTQCTTPINVGDVVVLQHPHRAGTVCKRVLGLPGDTVVSPRSQKGATQFFYHQHYNMEAYLGTDNSSTPTVVSTQSQSPAQSIPLIPYQVNLPRVKQQQRSTTIVVPDGHLWVEGDNPWNSNDSRNYGPVPASLIVGRVVCRVWPPLSSNKARLERGDRPIHQEELLSKQQQPSWSFSGSLVFPAGYRDEVIVRDYHQWQQIVVCTQQKEQPTQTIQSNETTTILRNLNRTAAAESKEPKPE